MTSAYEESVRDAIEDAEKFIRATFSAPSEQSREPWIRVVVRPVVLRGVRHLQFSRFTREKDLTKNYTAAAAAREIETLLRQGFRDVQIQMVSERIHVRVDRDGITHVRRRRIPAPGALDARHDQPKHLILGEASRPFLQQVGILGTGGGTRTGLARKHAQVNEFVRLLAQVCDDLRPANGSHLVIADLGCGAALLTFAAYHYLTEVRGVPARLFGVDLKGELMARHQAQADALEWNDVTFHAGRIAEFDPPERPDIVLALHACDTATDEALARAISWNSQVILSVPCCHHHLQAQLAGRDSPPPFGPVVRHGILRERLADALTDAFRASILRIMGYRADVIEFVSPEHTTRNLMIRAVRVAPAHSLPGHREAVSDYIALRRYWNVTPYLEDLLGASTLEGAYGTIAPRR